MLYDTAALESFVAAAPAEIHHRYLSSFFPGRAHESGGRGSEFISRAAGCPNVNAAISRMSLSAGIFIGIGTTGVEAVSTGRDGGSFCDLVNQFVLQ